MTNNVNVMSELEIMNAAMQVGWVKFSYYKADGTKRVAIGTRNKSLIECVLGRRLRESNNGNYYENYNGYFDLSRIDWRQFKTERFIGMEFDRLTNEQAVVNALAIIFVSKDYGVNDAAIARSHYQELVSADFLRDCMGKISYGYNLCAADDDDECESVAKVVNVVCERVDIPKPTLHFGRTEQPKKSNREKLIAELMELRKRESEILAELLA